jgi:hypothetical protein
MAVTRNMTIPRAISFARVENSLLCKLPFPVFYAGYGIRPADLIIESDEQAILKAVCQEFAAKLLRCLGNFLLSLKKQRFGYDVGNLVKCRTHLEFNMLKKVYEREFAEVVSNHLMCLNHTPRKAGLSFVSGRLIISDNGRFAQVSMYLRVPAQISSLTNALEGTHGY